MDETWLAIIGEWIKIHSDNSTCSWLHWSWPQPTHTKLCINEQFSYYVWYQSQ